MIFTNPVTAKITAPIVESGNNITFDGISIDESTTPENAAEQINKIFTITNQSVSANEMKRIIIQEAAE